MTRLRIDTTRESLSHEAPVYGASRIPYKLRREMYQKQLQVLVLIVVFSLCSNKDEEKREEVKKMKKKRNATSSELYASYYKIMKTEMKKGNSLMETDDKSGEGKFLKKEV